MWIIGVVFVPAILAYLAAFVSGFIALAGLLWAPFGALICARTARNKGLPVGRYAVAGAVFSVLYFFPWLYLSSRMNDRYLENSLIRWAYFVLYVMFWLFGVIVFGLFMLAFDFPSEESIALSNAVRSPGDPEIEVWEGPNPTIVRYVIIAQVVVNSVLWIVSLLKLREADKYSEPPHDWAPIMPHSAYILPFAYTLVGSVAMFATAWLGVGLWR